MATTGTSQDTRDYTSEVRKVHRVKGCKGNEVKSYDYLVDTYDNLTMVTGVIDRGENESVYTTSHGKLTLDSNAEVRILAGELYEPWAGVNITNFLRGLIQIRPTVKENINAVFNGIIFTVHLEDDIETLYTEIEIRRRLISIGELESYKY